MLVDNDGNVLNPATATCEDDDANVDHGSGAAGWSGKMGSLLAASRTFATIMVVGRLIA